MAPIQPTGTDPGEEGQFVIRDLEIIVINKESVLGYHAGLFVGKAVQL